MEQTLEQELQERIFIHKVAILGGTIMSGFIERQSKGDVRLPDFIIREQADKYSDGVMKQMLQNGTFNEMYEDAWNNLKDNITDDFKVTN